MPLPQLVLASRAHLRSAGETYFQHMRFASTVGSMLVAAGLACLLHALIPGVCRDTASRTIACLQRVVADRDSLADAQRQTVEAVAFTMMTGMAAAIAFFFHAAGVAAVPSLAVTLLALAVPVTLLVTNPDLKPEASAGTRSGADSGPIPPSAP